jgi:hypothetical protein
MTTPVAELMPKGNRKSEAKQNPKQFASIRSCKLLSMLGPRYRNRSRSASLPWSGRRRTVRSNRAANALDILKLPLIVVVTS